MNNNKKIKKAVDFLNAIPKCAVCEEDYTKPDCHVCKILVPLASSYLEASDELPERMEVDSIGIDAGDNHSMQCYGKGLNHAIDLCVPIVSRLQSENEELRKALQEMIEWHPRITQRIGSEGSEARYIQAHQEDAISYANKVLKGYTNDCPKR